MFIWTSFNSAEVKWIYQTKYRLTSVFFGGTNKPQKTLSTLTAACVSDCDSANVSKVQPVDPVRLKALILHVRHHSDLHFRGSVRLCWIGSFFKKGHFEPLLYLKNSKYIFMGVAVSIDEDLKFSFFGLYSQPPRGLFPLRWHIKACVYRRGVCHVFYHGVCHLVPMVTGAPAWPTEMGEANTVGANEHPPLPFLWLMFRFVFTATQRWLEWKWTCPRLCSK